MLISFFKFILPYSQQVQCLIPVSDTISPMLPDTPPSCLVSTTLTSHSYGLTICGVSEGWIPVTYSLYNALSEADNCLNWFLESSAIDESLQKKNIKEMNEST